MVSNLEILDKLAELRHVLGLLNLAARSLEMKHERDPLDHGTMIAVDLLVTIEAMADDRMPEQQEASE
ncbi:hypothetical protein [Rhizobium sp. BR 362]|uniref:hypothetical protein n=1 Tax=Rhizobium sp. BR 362 TaxID=3040670 RepID=UPI002F3F3EBB